jgi:hypothetical protein
MKRMEPIAWDALQKAQHDHDLRSHWDILCLPVPSRISHMILHFAKYVGRLAADRSDGLFEATLVDTLIIALASANILSMRIGDRLSNDHKSAIAEGLAAKEFGRQLAIQTGRLAKAREAFDHIESFGSRSEMEDAILTICALCANAAQQANLKVEELASRRWRNLETAQNKMHLTYSR